MEEGVKAWRRPEEAQPDGTICELLFRDGLGAYEGHGEFFLHDDGKWYRIEPPIQLTVKPYRWRPKH